jgi:hypothetical protein
LSPGETCRLREASTDHAPGGTGARGRDRLEGRERGRGRVSLGLPEGRPCGIGRDRRSMRRKYLEKA